MVGGGHAGNENREADGDEGDDAGAHVHRVVPGVGGEGHAAGLFPDAHFHGPKEGFEDGGADEGPERVGFRRVLVVPFGDGAPGNARAGGGEDGSDGKSGEDFEAAVAVGVLLVGGFGGDPEAEQDEAGHQDVGRGFEAVGDEGDGVGGKADGDFNRGESDADGNTGHRGAARGLFETPHASGYNDRRRSAASLLFIFLSLWLAFAQTSGRKPAAYAGEGKQATHSEINDPVAIAVDGPTLYIAESLGAIRRVDLRSGIIHTVPTKRELDVDSLAVDREGALYASAFAEDLVYRIDPRTGSITTVAGGGGKKFQFSGDGGLATEAELSGPSFVQFDAAGNLYIADMGNNRIRRVDGKTGIITTVAGSGKRDSSGDGGPALDAGLDFPNSAAVDREGNLFIAQSGYGAESQRIRRVDAKTGIITTIAGGPDAFLTGDGGPAGLAKLSPSYLLFGRFDNLYIVDSIHDRVRLIDGRTQKITTVAGSTKGFAGDGGPAIRAQLDNPCGIALDSEGNLFIAEFVNHRVRRVDARTGIIQTVAGNGFPHHVHVTM